MPDSHPQPQPPSQPSDRAGAGAAGLLLCGARLPDGRIVDVRLGGGLIEAVGTAGSLTAHGARLDLTGHLLLPAPAEPHAHSDTALTAADALGSAPGSPDASAAVSGGVPPGASPSYAPEDVRRRATEAALLQLGHGATAIRSHVRIGDAQGLGRLEALLQARRSLRGLVEITAVAVPRLLTGVAGADGLAMLRDAVRMGAGVVGGCPDLDPDPAGYVEAVLEVAAEHGCPVDLHTDGADPVRLARLAARAGGLRPGVTLGPCAGLGLLPAEVAGRAADQLAAAGVTVVCLPQGACGGVGQESGPGRESGSGSASGLGPASASASAGYGGGRRGSYGSGGSCGTDPRGVAPVRLLRAAGVRVAAGSGALRDVANPVGRGDPLEAAYLLASRGGLAAEDAYDAVSTVARAAMGLPEVRVEAGFPAELLAVRGDRIAGVLSLAYSRIVVHRGRVVARTSAVREYCDSEAAVALELPRQGGPDARP
ncbi:amidohydrolase family protein [Streptomyces liangshanensis]|uniref:Amidohydrolase family protein n=1 Tax=Streptomyces liangshanensis TaxID=2717324 RepID=A0A6G9GY80_9ACTN|nr:amidohydrolase family protein [Streptomyces liangshanensis]QIQ03228.1 amidohydrolase family protein [Streptomyces liangshanensis]